MNHVLIATVAALVSLSFAASEAHSAARRPAQTRPKVSRPAARPNHPSHKGHMARLAAPGRHPLIGKKGPHFKDSKRFDRDRRSHDHDRRFDRDRRDRRDHDRRFNRDRPERREHDRRFDRDRRERRGEREE
jgi:hypothetical protein